MAHGRFVGRPARCGSAAAQGRSEIFARRGSRSRVQGRDPIDVLEDQAASPPTGSRALSIRRMAESPFGFLRGAAAVMALDLSHDARDRAERPGVRRRPYPQLRPLRDARTQPRLLHQRLRRDAARAVGVGRQAIDRQPPSRRPRRTVSACRVRRDGRRGGARVPGGHGALRHDGDPRALVRPDRRRRRRLALPRRVPGAREARHEEGRATRPGAGSGKADARSRRRASVRRGPAAGRPHRQDRAATWTRPSPCSRRTGRR